MISFGSLGYVRVAVASPVLQVADIGYNVEKTVDVLREAVQEQWQLVLLPELGITSYSCADLFYQSLYCPRRKQRSVE